MSQPDLREEGQEEAPLDPATQRVQAKLKRLLLGSSLVMFVGFIAVFAAILYKINTFEPAPEDAPFAKSLPINAGAEVQQVTLSDGILLVLVRENGEAALLRFDAETGKELGRTEFVAQ